MKKFILFFIVILFALATPYVYGVTAKNEEMVTGPWAGSEPVPPPLGATKDEVKSIVGGVSKEVRNLKESLNGKNGSVTKLKIEVSGLAGSTRDLATATRDIATATKDNVKAVKKNTTAIENLQEYAEKVYSATSSQIIKNVQLICVLMVIGFIGLGFLIFFRVGSKKNKPVSEERMSERLNKMEAAIMTVADENRDSIIKAVKESQQEMEKNIPDAVNKLPKMVIELEDLDTVFIPPIVNRGGVDMYATLYVPDKTPFASDPTKIPRLYDSDKGRVRRSTRTVMSEYRERKATGTAPSTDREKMQDALIESLSETPELKI